MWKEDYSKTEISMCFLQDCLMTCAEAIEDLEKGELATRELSNVMWRLHQNSYSGQKNFFFFFNDSFKTQKMTAKLNRTFPLSLSLSY